MNASAQCRPTGSLADAIRRVRARLESHPDDVHSLGEAAVLLYQAGEPNLAADYALRATRLAPKDPLVYDHLCIMQLAAGKPEEAITAGRRATALAPKEGNFWINLGNAQLAAKDALGAVRSLTRACKLAPREARAWYNLANAFAALQQSDEAISALQRTIRLDSSMIEARRNLALLLREAKRPAEAAAVLGPLSNCDDPDILHLLGTLQLDANAAAEALAPLQKAVRLAPEQSGMKLDLVRCLVRLDRSAEASPLCEQLARYCPGNPVFWNLYGLCTKDTAAATSHFRKALELDPGCADAAVNLARQLVDDGRAEEALAVLAPAIALAPEHPVLHFTRGAALVQFDRCHEALTAYEKAVTFAPERPNAHFNLALCQLRLGNFVSGWEGFEWRWQNDGHEPPRFESIPRWPADSPKNGHLLLWAEQGVGDEVMFATLLTGIPPLADRVTLSCIPRLVTLFARSFPDLQVIAHNPDRRVPDPVVSADWQIPLGSLPARLWKESGPPGGGRPVLRPNPDLQAKLHARYHSDSRPAIGIAWRTSNAKNGSARSIAPDLWAPLLRNLPVRLVSLQYGDTTNELACAAAAGTSVEQDPEVDQMRDLDAFAAQVAALDAIVTIDNSTAHFAGALGIPTWVLLPTPADWRWRTEGDRTPWYQSVRIRRRKLDASWEQTMATAIEDVRNHLALG